MFCLSNEVRITYDRAFVHIPHTQIARAYQMELWTKLAPDL